MSDIDRQPDPANADAELPVGDLAPQGVDARAADQVKGGADAPTEVLLHELVHKSTEKIG